MASKSLNGQFATVNFTAYSGQLYKLVGRFIKYPGMGLVFFFNHDGFDSFNSIAPHLGFSAGLQKPRLADIKRITTEEFLQLTRNKKAAKLVDTDIKFFDTSKTKFKHRVTQIGDKFIFGCGEVKVDRTILEEYLRVIKPKAAYIEKYQKIAEKRGYKVTPQALELLLNK